MCLLLYCTHLHFYYGRYSGSICSGLHLVRHAARGCSSYSYVKVLFDRKDNLTLFCASFNFIGKNCFCFVSRAWSDAYYFNLNRGYLKLMFHRFIANFQEPRRKKKIKCSTLKFSGKKNCPLTDAYNILPIMESPASLTKCLP